MPVSGLTTLTTFMMFPTSSLTSSFTCEKAIISRYSPRPKRTHINKFYCTRERKGKKKNTHVKRIKPSLISSSFIIFLHGEAGGSSSPLDLLLQCLCWRVYTQPFAAYSGGFRGPFPHLVNRLARRSDCVKIKWKLEVIIRWKACEFIDK